MTKLCLWVDDERPQPEHSERTWMAATSFHRAIVLLEKHDFDEVSLDHDIASFYGNKEMTGYDIVMWLVQRKVDGMYHVPPVIKVHTANPVGRDNMQATIDRYLS